MGLLMGISSDLEKLTCEIEAIGLQSDVGSRLPQEEMPPNTPIATLQLRHLKLTRSEAVG
jgi:hypothetical protein